VRIATRPNVPELRTVSQAQHSACKASGGLQTRDRSSLWRPRISVFPDFAALNPGYRVANRGLTKSRDL
jgi:hypothetical protein